MTEKFTLRDILVYTIIGLTATIAYFLNDIQGLKTIISATKDYSDLTVLLLIPLTYLFGHLVMGIDDLIFNYLLYWPIRKVNFSNTSKLLRFYNFIFFGNRNLGIRNSQKIKNKKFLRTCRKLIKDGHYDKPEYYQTLSDLFKGLYLITVSSMYREILLEGNFNLKTLAIYLTILLIIWHRGRVASTYYVMFIKREM